MAQARRTSSQKSRRSQQALWLLMALLFVGVAAYFWWRPNFEKSDAEYQIKVATEQAWQALEVANHRGDEQAMLQAQDTLEVIELAKTKLITEDYAGAKALVMIARRSSKTVLALQSAKILEAYDAKILVEDIHGQLSVNGKQVAAKTVRGQPLKVGDILATGKQSAVKIYFANGIRLVLNADSQLHLQEDLKQIQPAILYLAKGHLTFETKDGPEGAFTHVITDQGAVFIKTNGFGWLKTQPGAKGESHLLLRSGRGRVANRWGEKAFLSNQHVTFNREGEPQVDDWLLSSPILQQPGDGSHVTSETGEYTAVSFDWADVKQAKHYTIQIARDPYFIQLVKQQGLLETSQAQFGKLQAGNYYWRVAAVDEAKRQGPYSRAANFRARPQQLADQEVRDQDPPQLKVTQSYVQGYYLLIWGQSDRDAVVYVNQEQAVLDQDTGSFFYTTSLPNEGHYTIHLRAEDPIGNMSETDITVSVKN